MRNRNRFLRVTFRRSRLIAAALSVVLPLSLSLGACGSSATSSTSPTSSASAINVVPVTGTVAGHGYGYWLQHEWQMVFSSPAPWNTCDTLTSNGQRVGSITFPTTPGTYHTTCSEPAGRPLYVWEPSAECSTFTGDHLTFGTADQQLRLCAPKEFKGTPMSATLDGKPVNLSKLVAATGAFPVQAATGSAFGFPAGSGRSAAYGAGLLLTRLAKGTHVIHSVFGCSPLGCSSTQDWDITLTVHVH